MHAALKARVIREGLERAVEALRAPPMSEAELAEYNSKRAAEMARAEARRQPSPQLALDGQEVQ